MALATNTTAGDIALAGDLNGNVNSPSLTTTGVVPATYDNAKFVVDAKGRIIHAEAITDQEVSDELDLVLTNPLPVPDATDSVKGYVEVDTSNGLTINSGVLGFDEVDIEDGTSTSKGIVQIDDTGELSISGGVLGINLSTLPIATNTSKGIVQIDTNNGYLGISGGELSFIDTIFPDSTGASKGVVQVDDSGLLNITSGVLGIDVFIPDDATAISKGVVQINVTDGLTIAAGVLGYTYPSSLYATASSKGVLEVDTSNGLTIAAGILGFDPTSRPDATASSKGLVQIDTSNGLTIAVGVANITTSTSSTLGVAKSADTNNITITAGAVDVGTNVALKNENTAYPTQTELTSTTTSDTLSPNFSNTSFFEVNNSGFMITIANPPFIPPKGVMCVVKIINSSLLGLGDDYISNNINAYLSGVNILLLESTGTKIKASLITDFPT